MPHAEFDVFLSHNSADKPDVLKLATKLRDLGLIPWVDAWHLVAGEPWLPAIERALDNSDCCAVVIGPNGMGNVHEDEMWVALQRGIESKRSDRRFRIIPILLPQSSRGDREKLPSFLKTNTWVEFPGSIDDPVSLDKLVKAIRGQAPGVGVTLVAGECPYRGLAYFDIQHTKLFLGREGLTDWLLSRLKGTATKLGPTRFLAIVGASGSGKSSLARAGVLAKLKAGELAGSENWPLVICRPECRPLESLATALAGLESDKLGPIDRSEKITRLIPSLLESPARLHCVVQATMPANDPDWRLVVFVDQFEELFTLNVPDPHDARSVAPRSALSADRVAFIRNLLHASTIQHGRTIVILTMRADFYEKCEALPELADAVSSNQQFVGPMIADELRRSIETPAQLCGSDIEPGLVDLLVREVADQPGALPLLQYALAELWNRTRESGQSKLTTEAYRELGGWEGALSRRADDVLAEFKNTPQEKRCRELFLRLVQPGEGREATKRLVRWDELKLANANDAADLEQIVRKLADRRLITTGGEIESGQALSGDATIEVVHEALIRGWDQLRKWLEADRADLRIHRQLTEAANEWAKSNPEVRMRDVSLLYTGSKLAAASKLSQSGSMRLNDLENQFVDASTQAVRSKKRRTMLGWVATVATFILLAAVGTIAAIDLRNEAVAMKETQTIVESLESAEPAAVPKIIKDLEKNPELAATSLKKLLSQEARTIDEKRQQLHARLAMVSHDKTLVEPLMEELLTNKVDYIGPIRQQLRPYADQLKEKLWAILRDKNQEAKRRFHAAAALADYVPASDAASWTEQDLKFVAEKLVSANPENQPLLRQNLRPIRERLLADFERIFSNPASTDAQRLSAANVFADYSSNDLPKLTQLLTLATPEQYNILYPIVAASPPPSTVEDLSKIAATLPPADLGSVERIAFGQRRANAAVTLSRLGELEKVLPVFEMTDDPEALTQFIFRCRERDVSTETLLDCLRRVVDAPLDRYPKNARYALLLALGEFELNEIPPSRREKLLTQLATWYRNDPSSGVHGAAGWLLRQWGQSDIARQVDQTEMPFTSDREWFTLAITVQPKAASEEAKPEPPRERLATKTFYYTFIVFPAGDYEIGSVDDESDRFKFEVRHSVKLTDRFALLDREITFEELIAYMPHYEIPIQKHDAKPSDAGFGMSWYDSVGFCRWLGQQSGLSEADQSYADPEELDNKKYPREPNADYNWAPHNWPLDMGRRGFRLPMESEWEVASRTGARTAFGFGGDYRFLRRFDWFRENGGKHVHPPRELRPNIRGLFDLHGNLCEWTHNWYQEYGTEANVDGLGDFNGALREFRGGSWSTDPAFCRSALRNRDVPTYRADYIGLRLALSLSGVSPEADVKK